MVQPVAATATEILTAVDLNFSKLANTALQQIYHKEKKRNTDEETSDTGCSRFTYCNDSQDNDREAARMGSIRYPS